MPQAQPPRLLAASVPAIGGAAAALHSAVPHTAPVGRRGAGRRPTRTAASGNGQPATTAATRASATAATVDHAANGFDPHEILRDFDWGTTRRPASGRVVREWELVAVDKEIEVAPGVRFAAWTYNGRIPGPTLRCREGERLRITFVNGSDAPAHDPLPRHPPGGDGRRARARRRRDRARAAARSTSSTRCPPACTSTTATSGRSPSTSPRASTARSSSTPRTAARTPTSWSWS